MFKIDPNFWKDVEDRDKLKFVKYSDTDSLYINLPTLDNNIDSTEAWNKISNISTKINNIIRLALDETMLPKLGINKQYNRTDFKTESLIISMLLIGIKKNYAYKKIAEEGVIYDSPKVKYKGIPIVRSDYSKFAQGFLKYIVDDIALNAHKLEKPASEMLQDFAKIKNEELFKNIDEFNFKYIGTPGRWSDGDYKKEPYTIIGMRLYNTLFDTEIFRPGTSGLSLPITILNKNEFLTKISLNKSNSPLYLNNTNIDNINYIVVPYNYEANDVKSKFEEFKIELNYEETWNKSVTKITKDIIEVIKNNS
jgi:hypothetical protein